MNKEKLKMPRVAVGNHFESTKVLSQRLFKDQLIGCIRYKGKYLLLVHFVDDQWIVCGHIRKLTK